MKLWFLLIGLVGLISACAKQDGVDKVVFNEKIVTLDRSSYGLQTMPRGPYIAIVRGLNERGWRVGTYAVGDAVIDLVLEAYERAKTKASSTRDGPSSTASSRERSTSLA